MNLSGTVDALLYKNDSNWRIFILNLGNNKVKVAGVITKISKGDRVEVSGEFEEKKGYGKTFKASVIRQELPTNVSDYANYLSSAISGIGPVISRAIVAKFGQDSFSIIENNPERLTEISLISKSKAKQISDQFVEKSMTRADEMFFIKAGVSNKIGIKIKKVYKSEYKKVLMENPYQIINDVEGIGFQYADTMAKKLGVAQDSIMRVSAGLEYMMEVLASSEGHTCYDEASLAGRAARYMGVSTQRVLEGISKCAADGKIVKDKGYVYLKKYFTYESVVAANIVKLCEDLGMDEKELEKEVIGVEKENHVSLDPTQRKAVIKTLNSGFSVITGGPGVGKTTTLNIMIKCLLSRGYRKEDIMLVAPTGRAAKRMKEQTKMEAMTIHRLAASLQTEEGMQKADADVIIADETSMVDLELMHTFLKLVPDHAKVVMVGDVDQLPSVGAGNVLRDVINSGVVPVSRLTKVFRQAADSHIISYAHKINNGEELDLATKYDDFFCVRQTSTEIILKNLKLLIGERIPKKFGIKPQDVQILAPMRKGELGINDLNEAMRDFLNPASKEKKEYSAWGVTFREGDKVMHIKNNYSIEWFIPSADGKASEFGSGIFNGETGYIKKIQPGSEQIMIEYDEGRIAIYEYENMNQVTHAYAVTIHKSQGSEYPAVVMPLLTSGPDMLYNKNLLYTGITRAKECVAILGSPDVVKCMAKNQKSLKRYATLSERLRDASA